jgi:hypothetical protein
MMWQLAQDAWAFKGEDRAESGLPRHLVRVHRRDDLIKNKKAVGRAQDIADVNRLENLDNEEDPG